MAEPSKDRDKAVDEALATFGPYDERKVLNLLWQRAQEAEREENVKAVAHIPYAAQAIRNRAARPHGRHHPDCAAAPNVDNGYPAEACDCRAARASEEPKA